MKKDFEDLVASYWAGTLQEGEFAELKRWLQDDEQNLKQFCDEADFEQALREVSVSVPLASLERPAVIARGQRKWGWAAAAVLFLSLGLAGLLVLGQSRTVVLADLEVSPRGLIAISGPAEGKRKEGELEKGSTLRVAQGSVKVEFREGVRCFLEAPAELTLERKGLVYLRDGRARFDVEKRARGFQVISGDMELTDLGTSFGVDASQATPEVHVLSGLVVSQSRKGKREETRVEGGNAMALAAEGEMTPIPIDSARFRSSLGAGIPALYLSLDGAEDGEALCEGSIAWRDGVQLVVDGSHAPSVVEGRFGKALRFAGESCHARTNWPGISGSQARTVSFWLKVEEAGLPNPILGWGLIGQEKMSFFGIRLERGGGRLRIVSGRRWLAGSSKLDDGEWHHVVVVTGDYRKGAWPVTKLWVNGEPELLTPTLPLDGDVASLNTFETITTAPGSEPLMLGKFMDDEKGKPWNLRGFAGLLDEVIVAEGLLDEDGVRALYEGRLEDSGLELGRVEPLQD